MDIKDANKESESQHDQMTLGDNWFKYGLENYTLYLSKAFEAKDKRKKLKSLKKSVQTLEKVKTFYGELQKINDEIKLLDEDARKLYAECMNCLKKSFDVYEKLFTDVTRDTTKDEELFNKWGRAVYVSAVINRGEYYYNDAKCQFEQAINIYDMITEKSDAIRRHLGNAYYELAAIEMDNCSYKNAWNFFNDAIRYYKKIDALEMSDIRNWGNALFEQGIIAWRKYTFLKVTKDPLYKSAILKEVRKLPRYRDRLEDQNDGFASKISFGKGVNNWEKEMENSYKTSEKKLRAAEKKYLTKGVDAITKEKYVDVFRSLGEMYLVFGRRKRYEYLSIQEKLEQLKKDCVENISKEEQKYIKAIKDATHNFDMAIGYFENAKSLCLDGEEIDILVYLGATKYRLFLTYATTNYVDIGMSVKAKKEAEEYFKKTKMKILDILVDLSEDICYPIINDDILFSLLDGFDNDDAVFFKNIIKSKQFKNGYKEILCEDDYKEIYIRSMYVINRLEVDTKYENVVAHYTNKSVAQKLLSNGGRFRLGGTNYLNDPTEGKLLLDSLFDVKNNCSNATVPSMNRMSEYATFAGSFSFNYDSLIQFRLYGKENKDEATGLSLVFNKTFFKGHLWQDRAASLEEFEQMFRLLLNKRKWNTFKKLLIRQPMETPWRTNLYRCIYFDPENGRVDTIGQKERYLFYRENLGKSDEEYIEYQDFIHSVVHDVNVEIDILRYFVKYCNADAGIVGQLMLKLRYLVKHVAFKVEQECRIVKNSRLIDTDEEEHLEIGSKEAISKGDLRIHLKYDFEVSQHVKEIYFGPNATGIKMYRDYLIYKGLEHIECKESQNPFIGDSRKEWG